MKLKLNLNVDAVKQLAIQHGEKAAFGVAICLLLLFFWNTLQMEVLPADRQVDPLRALAERTKQHVISSEWDPKAKKIEVVDYPARAKPVRLLDDHYHLKVYFDKPLWDLHGKRPVPKLWPVEELQAVSDRGILAIKKQGKDARDASPETRPISGDPNKNRRGARVNSGNVLPEGVFYVAITGLVPVRKQTAEYEDAFQTAEGYAASKDVPVYEDIGVERAEVNGSNPNKLDWRELNLDEWWAFEGTWPDAQVDDVVDRQYVDDACTMPLGPLMGEDWSPAVAGHPKIPLAERLDKSKKTEKKEEAPAPVATHRGKHKRGDQPGTNVAKTNLPAAAKSESAGPKVDEKLFRFVDYTVEAGKQYRYRVKLKLENPNFKKPDRQLDDPEQTRVTTLETVWSEPTGVVTVPRGFRILAGPISTRTNNSPHDPEVEIGVISFDRERGGEPAAKKPVQRGTLMNFTAKEVWVPTADQSALANWGQVDFHSDALIVDVQGGRKLSTLNKSLVEPVEMLVLDAEGHAMVHSELTDTEEFHARFDLLKAPPPKTQSTIGDNPYETKPTKPRSGKSAKTPRT